MSFTKDQSAGVLVSRGLLETSLIMAEWHIGDGDECGKIARKIYQEIKDKHPETFQKVLNPIPCE